MNGDYWHANPQIYKSDDIIKFKFGNRIAKEIRENDFNKNKEKIKNLLHEYFKNKVD